MKLSLFGISENEITQSTLIIPSIIAKYHFINLQKTIQKFVLKTIVLLAVGQKTYNVHVCTQVKSILFIKTAILAKQYLSKVGLKSWYLGKQNVKLS